MDNTPCNICINYSQDFNHVGRQIATSQIMIFRLHKLMFCIHITTIVFVLNMILVIYMYIFDTVPILRIQSIIHHEVKTAAKILFS